MSESRAKGERITNGDHQEVTNQSLELAARLGSIDWIANSNQAEILGISTSQLRRDKWLLSQLGIAHFDRMGCSKDSFLRLYEFRLLVEQRGREPAAKWLIQKYKGANQNNGRQKNS